MKRLTGLLLAFILLFSFFPIMEADAGSSRPEAPDFEIRSNRLYLNDSLTNTEYIFELYEFVLIREKDYTPSLLSQFDVEDLYQIPLPTALPIVPDPQDMLTGSRIKSTGVRLSLGLGDVILARAMASSSGRASEWKVLQLNPRMFAPTTASSPDDLPVLSVTDSSLSATLRSSDNFYTRYEYTIIPAALPANFEPVWIPLGSASERGDAPITAYFLPSASPYTIYVRIEGDDKSGFLFNSIAGETVDTPKILFSQEKLGPLSGGTDGSKWYFTSSGGKKWEEFDVQPGEESFIDLARVFGKNSVGFQLKKSDPDAEGDPKDFPTVLEGTLKPRPEFPKSIVMSAFVSEQYPENWTLKGSRSPLEYSLDNLEWTPLIPEIGMPLLSVEQQTAKVKAAAYFIRIAPSESSVTPASATKKFSQPKQAKAPSAKPDYKRETIKLKAGLKYSFAGAGTEGSPFVTASGDTVSIEDAISNGQAIYVYTPENGKKSRSAVQVITFAERGESPDEGEGLIINKTSASLEKGFEYYGSKDKWGSFTKGDTKGIIRRKATAKYNAKTNTNTGFAASGTVACTIKYADNGKNVASIEMEKKKALPLHNWNLSLLSGGKTAYDSFANGSHESYIVIPSQGSLVSFSISPSFAPDDQVLIASMTVAVNDDEPVPISGAYSFKDLKEDDVVTLTATPKNTGIYRKTVAAITIIPPHEDTPKSIAFGSVGSFGMVTVTLTPVPLGQTRTLCFDYVRMPEGKVVFSREESVEYIASNNTTDTREFDFREAMAGAGTGSYEMRSYIKGALKTSDSLPVKVSATFTEADFGVRFWTVASDGKEMHATNNPPRIGREISVQSLSDSFGNILTASDYQWYRVSGNTRYVITRSDDPAYGRGPGYTPVSADSGYILEIYIYCNEAYFTYRVPGTVR